MSEDGLYVYGVVGRARLPRVAAGDGLRLVPGGGVSALVADRPASPVKATRRNLLQHADVVESAFAWTTILPMRFGIVFPDETAVREQLLEPNRELLESLLVRHESTAELTLKASYDEDAVLAELLATSPRLARKRERYRADPAFDTGLALGEAVAAELATRRDRDAGRIVDALVPLALDARTADVPAERGVLNLALLVDRSRVSELDAAVEELSAGLSPPIHFKLVGPLPPYSFVDIPLAIPEWA